MSRLKKSAMPGGKVVASLEYWWKLQPKGVAAAPEQPKGRAGATSKLKGTVAPTLKPKGIAAAPKQSKGRAAASSKVQESAATPRPKGIASAPKQLKGKAATPKVQESAAAPKQPNGRAAATSKVLGSAATRRHMAVAAAPPKPKGIAANPGNLGAAAITLKPESIAATPTPVANAAIPRTVGAAATSLASESIAATPVPMANAAIRGCLDAATTTLKPEDIAATPIPSAEIPGSLGADATTVEPESIAPTRKRKGTGAGRGSRGRPLGPSALGLRPASIYGNQKPNGPVPKKRKISPASLISAINRGSITNSILGTIRNADPEQSPALNKALKDFDPTAGVREAMRLIEAKVEKKYEKYCGKSSYGLTLGRATEQTGYLSSLGEAFLAAGLPVQSAFVYMCLIKVVDSWLWQKCYIAYDDEGMDELHAWDEGLKNAVAMLDCTSDRKILEGLKRDLTTVVNSQSSAYGVDLEGPLSECRLAVNQLLEGKEYTCSACREPPNVDGYFRHCDDACGQQVNYAATAAIAAELAGEESGEESEGSDEEVEGEEGEEGGEKSALLRANKEKERPQTEATLKPVQHLVAEGEINESTSEPKRQKLDDVTIRPS